MRKGVSDMKEQDGIFREESIKRVTSPEELREYIRIAAPSVWLALFAMLIFLAGFVVWSVFGTVTIHTENGTIKEVAPATYVMN